MKTRESSIAIKVDNNEHLQQLLGRFDQHINIIDRYFKVKVTPQGDNITITGSSDDTEKVALLFQE